MISQSKQKGFTIVELLIVIVVIGILAAISIVAYNGVTQKARDDERITDARNIVNAASSYQAENGAWPTVAQLKGDANITGKSTAFNTVKLSGNASGRLSDATGAVTSTNKDSKYLYVQCGTTGIAVDYFNENDNVAKRMTTGSGCTTTPAV